MKARGCGVQQQHVLCPSRDSSLLSESFPEINHATQQPGALGGEPDTESP